MNSVIISHTTHFHSSDLRIGAVIDVSPACPGQPVLGCSCLYLPLISRNCVLFFSPSLCPMIWSCTFNAIARAMAFLSFCINFAKLLSKAFVLGADSDISMVAKAQQSFAERYLELQELLQVQVILNRMNHHRLFATCSQLVPFNNISRHIVLRNF